MFKKNKFVELYCCKVIKIRNCVMDGLCLLLFGALMYFLLIGLPSMLEKYGHAN